MSRRCLAAILLASGCTGASLPQPTVVSVSPPERPASSSGLVTVTLDAVLPTVADYGAGITTVDDRLVLKLGPRVFGPPRWTDAGVVTDFLPSVLSQGSYDVTVLLGDGRLAIATNAFRVTTGEWPAGYTLDPIRDQTSGVPFSVTMRVAGAPDGGYGGTVNLSVAGARITPATSGPFVAGVRVEVITVTVDDPRTVQLVVSDLAGHSGTSSSFRVR